MKFLTFLVIAFGAGLLLSSCQKVLSFDAALAKGSLKSNAGGDCMPVTVSGAYQKDTLLTSANYIDIAVKITTPGIYDIKTDTINGYSFHGTGTVADTGLHMIRLAGSGRPVAPSADVFTVSFDTTRCEVNINVTGSGTASAAVFTLGIAGTTCTGAVLSAGTYICGFPATGNTVTLTANVTAVGPYGIATNGANGIIYSTHGTFTTTGNITVVLTAAGTANISPTPVTATYDIGTNSGGTGNSGCSFTVTYAATPAAGTYTVSCGAVSVSGLYQIGVSMGPGNFITIPVNVTATGFYSVSTGAPINGISFNGSGSYTTTGPQNIILRPVIPGATPTGAAGTVNYTFIAPGNPACGFPVTYTAAGGAPDYIRSTIDGGPVMEFSTDIFHAYDNTSNPFSLYTFYGYTDVTHASSIVFDLGDLATPTGPLPTGTYSVNNPASKYINCEYFAGGGDFEDLTDGTTTHPAPALTLIITLSTATRIEGTFTGLLTDNFGPGTHTINGSFSLPNN